MRFFEVINFFYTPVILMMFMALIILFMSGLNYFTKSLNDKCSGTYFNSLYYTTITFFTVGYGDIHPTKTTGKTISMITGGIGVLFMGLFVSASYSSFNEYKIFRNKIPHDKQVVRILGEINQDIINIFGNYGLGQFSLHGGSKLSDLNLSYNKIKERLNANTVPDLNANYHQTGKDAFMRNIELVNEKIQELNLLDFDTNYSAKIKGIAYSSRNIVNTFLWNSFKKSNFKHVNKNWIENQFIGESSDNPGLMGSFVKLQHELQKAQVELLKNLNQK